MHQKVSHTISMHTLFTMSSAMGMELNRYHEHIGRDHSLSLNFMGFLLPDVGPRVIKSHL